MKLMKVLALGVTVGGVALTTAHEKVSAAEWTPRTVEQIKADVSKSNGNYTIVEGDHLWGISQATNITVQKLADMNKIANVDLIYAGNKLIFSGNVASVQNSAGDTVAQTVIQPQDKVNPSQPVGQPAQNTNSNYSESNNTTTGNTKTGGQATGSTGATTPSTPQNNGGSAQIPTQPENNQGGQTTPSTPENNGGTTTPSQPSQPENGGNQGGTTTDPSKPTNPDEPVKMKYTVWAEFPNAEDNAKYGIKEGQYFFDTEAEATAWIDKYTTDLAVNQGISSNSYGVVSWEA